MRSLAPLDASLAPPVSCRLLLGHGVVAKISISYRRSDSQDITGRIFDRLVQRFGRDAVFRDIDNIRPGVDFRKQIAEVLQATNVLLVIVGPRWFARSEQSDNRIDNEADPVRIEVETALKRDIPVIPVLVGGAEMPRTTQLPDSLKDFAFRHAVTVDGGLDFDNHLSRLIRDLDRIFADLPAAEARDPPRPSRGAAPARSTPPAAPQAQVLIDTPPRADTSPSPPQAVDKIPWLGRRWGLACAILAAGILFAALIMNTHGPGDLIMGITAGTWVGALAFLGLGCVVYLLVNPVRKAVAGIRARRAARPAAGAAP
jgi:hypothetical protein